MDLTRLQELAYLEKITKNDSLLIKEIELTKGYVLSKLNSSGLLPGIDVLMNNLNEYSIQFVMDNYKLDIPQKEKILQFLSDSSEATHQILLNLSEKEVNRYLKENKLLPKETILSVEQINIFQKEIVNQSRIEDNHLEKIIQNSFNKFTIDDYFKIDKDFLSKNIYLMDIYSYLSNKSYKDLYKELVLSSKHDYDIRSFKSYSFEENEKKFLLKLLKSSSDWSIDSYSQMSNIRGFSSLIQKDEYFELFNSKSLKDYSDSEVESKKEFIQSVWLKKDLKSYDVFNDFLYKDCSVKQFATIMDKDFIMKIINKSNTSRVFGNVDTEREDIGIKNFHLTSHFLDLIANQTLLENGRTIASEIRFYEIFKLIDDLKESRHSYHNKNHPDFEELSLKNNENIEKLFTQVMPQYLKIDGIYRLLDDSKYILNNKTIDSVETMVDKNSNINMFYWLLSSHSDWANQKGYNSENISEKLEFYLEKIHKKILTKTKEMPNDIFENNIAASLIILNGFSENEFIKKLKSNYSFSKKISSFFEDKKYLVQDENIFFAYEGKKLTDINERLWSVTARLRPEFYDEIIKRKELAPDTFIYHCLNNSDNKKIKDFLVNYVKLHREKIEKNESILPNFLSNSNQKEIFPRSSNETKIYKELLELMEQEHNINQERKSIENLKESGTQRAYSRKDLNLPEIDIEKFDEKILFDYKIATKLDIQTRYVDLYKKEEFLNKQQTKLKGKLSFEFMQEKFIDLIKEKNFTQIAYLEKERMLSSHNDLLVEFINNQNFTDLMECFKDKSFLELFKSQINYENNTKIKLNNFSEDENNKVAKKLIKLFKDDKKKVFYFFEEGNRKFIKNFVIENMPEEIFYSYSFLVKDDETYKPTNFVNEPYTNEEIYKAFKKLDDKEGFFSDTGVNSRVNTFFSNTFGSSGYRQDKKEKLKLQKKSLDRYLNFLDFAKEKNLKLYVLAAHSDCFINTIGWGEKDESGKTQTRDEIIHKFFMKNFDFDLILKGMKEIVDEMKERHGNKFNSNNASGAIVSIIHNTYYDNYDENNRSVYYSSMGHEDTKKLFKFLFNEAPMICVERHKIGNALEPEKFFKENVQDIVNINNIENFLYPDNRVSTQYLSVHNKGDQQERLLSFFTSIVNNALDTKDSATLEYLLHLVKQKEFSSKEMSYRSKRGLNKIENNHSSDMFMEVIQDNQDMKALLNTLILKNKLDNSLGDEKEEKVELKRKKI